MNMTAQKNSLQDAFLSDLVENKTSVSVFMVNGIKLDGTIMSYDQFSIMLDGRGEQLIYKQKISTIGPQAQTRPHTPRQ